MEEDLVKGGEALSKSRGFRVSNIPLILYNEVSSRFGMGDEESGSGHNGDFWKRRSLNHEIPLVGFKGTIGVEKHGERLRLSLWTFLFSEVTDTYYRDRPLLRISAGPRSGGIWAYGHGNLVVESADATFELHDANLATASVGFVVRFAAMILFRASQIACDPRCVGKRYWEVERNPAGNFTGEDDEY